MAERANSGMTVSTYPPGRPSPTRHPHRNGRRDVWTPHPNDPLGHLVSEYTGKTPAEGLLADWAKIQLRHPKLTFTLPEIPPDATLQQTTLGSYGSPNKVERGALGYVTVRNGTSSIRVCVVRKETGRITAMHREACVEETLADEYPGLKWNVYFRHDGIFAQPYDNGDHGARRINLEEIEHPIYTRAFHEAALARQREAADAPNRCQHKWGEAERLGRCLNRYTCTKCGVSEVVDSSD